MRVGVRVRVGLRLRSGPDQRADDFSADIRQPEVAALIMIGQLAVIESQQVKDRRLKVVDMDGSIDGIETDLVGRAHGLTGADAAAGHPDCEGVDMVIAADRAPLPLGRHLHHVASSELTAPDHQRAIQQATSFEVFDERGEG